MADLDLHKLEEKWQAHWQKERVAAFDSKSGKPVFSIDVPPPTVSGKMHLGHALGYSQADVIARYKKMQGFNLFYPFGYDDNGLATERFVEKTTKKRAKDMTRAEFVKLCLDTTKEAEAELERDFKSLGLATDWQHVYRTIEDNSVKIAQESFLDLHKKTRVYRTETPHMYCTQCRTAIAQAELEDQEKDSFFNDIFFELENGEKIIISTTRPELLPACVSIFVHPDDERHQKLVGQKAKVPLFEQTVEIRKDSRVNKEKGTGIVMCCTFGDQTDMEWQKAHKLPIKIAIGLNGRLTEIAGEYTGLKVKEAREKILEQLKEQGLLKEQRKITHVTNVHERCKTPVEFLVSKQWFVKYLDLKQKFLDVSNSITWNPDFMKVRLENWVSGLQWDWCISRQRYFGVPFPVWYCTQCGTEKLADQKQLPVDPLQDKPEGTCNCGSKEFEAEKDVLDTWFTSSMTPQINSAWTLDDTRFKKMFPMSLRPQGHDIITLWAFNTIVKSVLHHDSKPWETTMINGFALDSTGKKMSKSLGNTIAPQKIIEQFSADALRYWTCSVSLGEDVPYKEKELVSGRRLLVKMWNASRLIEAVVEDFNYEKADEDFLKFQIEDAWILSRLNSLVEKTTKQMDAFQFSRALAETRDFFWLEFCDFYLEQIKGRIYESTSEADKTTAQFVLVSVFRETLKLFAPFLPHMTEQLYLEAKINGLPKVKSIHEEQWPRADKEKISPEAEAVGKTMNRVIAEVRKEKSKAKLSMNAEIKTAHIRVDNTLRVHIEKAQTAIERTCKILKLDITAGNSEKTESEEIKIKLEY